MSRRTYGWLAIAAMAFAIYVSIIPLRFTRVPAAAAVAEFDRVMRAPGREWTTRSNYIANVLLFVPIGFALTGTLALDRRRRTIAAAALAVLPTSLAVSLTAEFLQVFVPGRVVSRHDVVAQLIGTTIGIAAWTLVGQALTGALRTASDRQRGDRIGRALSGYAAAWVFVNLAPFDATFDPGALLRRYRSGMINPIPLAYAGSGTELLWDAALTLVAAMPLGALGLVGWTGRRVRRHSSAALLFGVAFVVGVELVQVFLRHHAADVNDVLSGTAGVAAGVWAGRTLLADRRAARVLPRRTVSGRALALLGLWCAVLCAVNWRPFDFTLDVDHLRGALRGVSLVPFAGYWSGPELRVFSNVLAKIGLAVPLGVVAAFIVPLRVGGERFLHLGWVAVAAGIFGAIEAGQLLLPSRTPDPTDVLVSVAAAWFGLLLGRWMQSGLTLEGERVETRGWGR